MVKLGVIGAGRIGRLFIENIATRVRTARIEAVADIHLDAARAATERFGVPVVTPDYRTLLENPAIDAVLICSATDTHLPLIRAVAASGKHVFCEKPIGVDVPDIERTLEVVARAGVKLQIGFNRRFDPSFAKAREMIAAGKVGTPQLVRVTSRDPAPPPIEYVRVSGGLYLDMAIHDFDMVRFLTGSEPVEIYAAGAALVDAAIGEAGDIDTSIVTIRLANGALATIDNSRKAVYGYDQRVEVFGSGGMVTVPNRPTDLHVHLDAEGVHSAKPQYFFLERYQESYVAEIEAFVRCVSEDSAPLVSGRDGLAAVVMSRAALKSLKEGRPVAL